VVSCCGVTLPPLSPEEPDKEHTMGIEIVEDEYYVTMNHPMTKSHYISFLSAVSDRGVELVKLYPEGSAEARFKINRVRWLYACCNRDGLFRLRLPLRRR
jgi:desulfoferrodoxin (superoxide reductase-like protein)